MGGKVREPLLQNNLYIIHQQKFIKLNSSQEIPNDMNAATLIFL